jgi:hypothetical protein
MKVLQDNKSVWRSMDDADKERYAEKVYLHYRKHGFPYFPTDIVWRASEFKKLKAYDYTRCIDEDNKLIKQSMHGLALAWSYHPHHYEIPCNDMMTVMDAFNDDDIFRRVIKKRMRLGDNMSDNGIRKMLKIYSGVQCVSNFRPTAAAAIYEQFSPQGGFVYDMSSGFGGRLLGAHISGRKYIGVEPSIKTFNGLNEMIDDFDMDATILKQGSEYPIPLDHGTIDLCFTSPPYFDCEKYSDEPTQSYIKYPTAHSWVNGFLRDTVTECHRVLKSESNLLLNIQNVKTYPKLVDDVIEMVSGCGFKYVNSWSLQLSNLTGSGFKGEPILIFKKR